MRVLIVKDLPQKHPHPEQCACTCTLANQRTGASKERVATKHHSSWQSALPNAQFAAGPRRSANFRPTVRVRRCKCCGQRFTPTWSHAPSQKHIGTGEISIGKAVHTTLPNIGGVKPICARFSEHCIIASKAQMQERKLGVE